MTVTATMSWYERLLDHVEWGDRRALGAAGLLLLVVAAIPAGIQERPDLTIEIDGVRPLAQDSPPVRLVETYLAASPPKPDTMIASAMSRSLGGAVVYATWDGGSTWRRVEGPEAPVFPGGDPMVAFDGNGRAYLSTLGSGFSVWRSTDGGRTWRGPVRVGDEEGYDRPWVAASGSPGRGVLPVYAAAKVSGEGTLFASMSRDGGRTFTELLRMPVDSGSLHAPTDLEVRGNGTILLPYVVYHGSVGGGRGLIRGRRYLLISEDGGESWTGPHRVAETLIYGNAAERELMLKGLGGGSLAVDESGGPFHGTIYMVWPQVVDGFIQIVVSRSRDSGRSWSSPRRVNGGGYESHHSTPEVAVGRNGEVAVTWNDRRRDPAGQCYHHYVAVSDDGARTFGPERRISEQETCLPTDYRWQNGGDTQGLAPLPDGGFRVVWTGPGPEAVRPWTAVVRVDGPGRHGER